ncbi:MAG: FAD-dependent oxidoreductase [Candidatus Solibacter sp.]|jgi:hypothetical protein
MMALGAGKVPRTPVPEAAIARVNQFDSPRDPTQSNTGRVAEFPPSGGYIRPGTIEVIHQKFDLVVVGGGIAGTCAAISAARNGARVALVHERSMLGGNSSSDVRLFPEDTCRRTPWIKESGILEEIRTEERVRNWEPYDDQGMMNSHWDLVLYEWAVREKQLTLFLNTTMREVSMVDPEHIQAIRAAQLGTEKEFVIYAPLFVDATGDGVLGYRAGAEFRWGKEAREEYQESLAPELASNEGMGNTIYFRARDTGKPVEFRKPDWAANFDSEADLTERSHEFFECGYWWIEVGWPLHPIKDSEEIRHEALRQLLGVWDHIKNKCKDDHIRSRAESYALEFVGFCPYKREARRILGDYVLRERDVLNPQVRDDDVAHGGWGIDIHTPGGILKRTVPPYSASNSDSNFEERGTMPYGIPLRCCYSRNVRNLFTAGRPISTSYVAFGSSRVLTTGAVVGQAVGVAAALCGRWRCQPRDIVKNHMKDLQQLLLRQDGFIPGVENYDPGDLARSAEVSASSEGSLIFPLSQSFHPARLPLAQLFPVSTDHLETIELLLKSSLAASTEITLGLRKAEHVWDFRSSRDLVNCSATIQPGYQGFVPFVLNARTEPGKLYYMHIGAHEGVAWALYTDAPGELSNVPAGTTSADLPGRSRWRPLPGGSAFCVRFTPQQRPYSPGNVVRGSSRPDLWTNFYMSDPAKSLPQWIEVRLPRPTRFNQVQITFDTDLNRQAYLPLFRYPECVKRYDIAIWTALGWKVVAGEEKNYYRRRVHSFAAMESDRVRINVYETNGAKVARIYEVRIYQEDQA